MGVAEMSTMRWMSRHTRRDRISNECYLGQDENGLCGVQDEGDKNEMAGTCKGRMHRCLNEKV